MNKLIPLLLILILTGFGCTKKPAETINVAGLQNPENSTVTATDQPLPYQLDMSGQGLTKMPSEVFQRTELVELNLAGNRLSGSLPAEVRQLNNLVVLNLSNNQFTGVPAEIGQLVKLEILNLANNKLTGLPYELGNLQNLKILNLSGNNYSQQDLDIIQSKLPSGVNIIK